MNYAGQTVSHYRVLEKLGHGGMGVVYKAYDDRLQRFVALKFLPADFKDDHERRRRLVNEARAASALDHPNIVVVHDIGETPEGALFIAMAFHDGETLQARIARGLSREDAVSIARQVASGLARAHEHGLFHRDIKPANIIIAKDGIARIIDFGLAYSLDATTLVDAGIAGTPLYMSPEQAAHGTVDARTDVWSFGVVLYEMLTGRRPFGGDSIPQLLLAIANDTPTPVRVVRPDVPVPLAAIVDRALAKRPADRYQTAGELAKALTDAEVASTEGTVRSRMSRSSRVAWIATAALTLALLAGGAWIYHRSERRHWVVESAIPQIAAFVRNDRPLAAFLLTKDAEAVWPDHPDLKKIENDLLMHTTLQSTPSGAVVQIQDFLTPDQPWFTVGTTPLTNVALPDGYFRWRVAAPNLPVYEFADVPARRTFALDAAARAPSGMVPVPAMHWTDMVGFVGWVGPYDLPAFDIDRFEVTNQQYQEFVDRGGYMNQKYWTEAFIRDDRAVSWSDAMMSFRDATGRPGPAGWRGGHFPDERANYPVSGISWYEAAAYAAFSGKSLPTLAQWYESAPPGRGRFLAPVSNLSGTALAPVGQFKGIGRFGTYDMAGNVREWCANSSGQGDRRFILGGAWSSPAYLYGEPEALPPFDRSEGNGIRLVINHGTLPPDAVAPRQLHVRDESTFKPAGDDLFKAYRSLYTYEPMPLQAKTLDVSETSDWRREKIEFDAAYGTERLRAFLYLPKHVKPPYQAVVFFPSARVEFLPSSDNLGDLEFFDYVVQSGRAVIYPIYQATYERLSPADRQNGSRLPTASRRRDVLIQQVKDVQRAVDYLQSRADIDADHIGYLGVSMGSAYGAIADAVEGRFKAIVWLDGGLFMDQPLSGTDQVDFAPRITTPLLMVNGRYDYVFPLDSAQLPLFRLVGTPAADKRHVILDTPHGVSAARPLLIRAVLEWFDRYLGVVH